MRFEDMLQSLAVKSGFSPSWARQLAAEARRVRTAGDALERWTGPQGTTPTLDYIEARAGHFDRMPGNVCRIGSNTDQTITTATTTLLSPAAAISPSGPHFAYGVETNVDPAWLNLSSFGADQVFSLSYLVTWASVTAALEIVVSIFDTDTGVEGLRVSDVSYSTGFPCVSGSVLWRVGGTANDRLDLRVWHNKGSALAVDYWRFGAVRVR